MDNIKKERRKRYRCYVCNNDDAELMRFIDWYRNSDFVICTKCLKLSIEKSTKDDEKKAI